MIVQLLVESVLLIHGLPVPLMVAQGQRPVKVMAAAMEIVLIRLMTAVPLQLVLILCVNVLVEAARPLLKRAQRHVQVAKAVYLVLLTILAPIREHVLFLIQV